MEQKPETGKVLTKRKILVILAPSKQMRKNKGGNNHGNSIILCSRNVNQSSRKEDGRGSKGKGKDVDIVAYPFTEMERVIEGVDVALLGPQVGYQLARAKEICDPKGVPVDVIPMQDYGMCNGMNVLKFAYKLAKNK